MAVQIGKHLRNIEYTKTTLPVYNSEDSAVVSGRVQIFFISSVGLQPAFKPRKHNSHVRLQTAPAVCQGPFW